MRSGASSFHAPALRSQHVLGCAQGLSNKQAAVRDRVSPSAVGKWRRRFVEAHSDGLVDDLRPGRPAMVSAKQVEDVPFVVTRSEVYVKPRKLQPIPGLVSSE